MGHPSPCRHPAHGVPCPPSPWGTPNPSRGGGSRPAPGKVSRGRGGRMGGRGQNSPTLFGWSLTSALPFWGRSCERTLPSWGRSLAQAPPPLRRRWSLRISTPLGRGLVKATPPCRRRGLGRATPLCGELNVNLGKGAGVSRPLGRGFQVPRPLLEGCGLAEPRPPA